MVTNRGNSREYVVSGGAMSVSEQWWNVADEPGSIDDIVDSLPIRDEVDLDELSHPPNTWVLDEAYVSDGQEVITADGNTKTSGTPIASFTYRPDGSAGATPSQGRQKALTVLCDENSDPSWLTLLTFERVASPQRVRDLYKGGSWEDAVSAAMDYMDHHAGTDPV